MAERRALIEGVKEASKVAASLEKQFVFGEKVHAAPQTPAATPTTTSAVEVREEKTHTGKPGGRAPLTPLTTRIRSDLAVALKRASLERQLQGIEPSTVKDMLEDALEPWLRSHGYLT